MVWTSWMITANWHPAFHWSPCWHIQQTAYLKYLDDLKTSNLLANISMTVNEHRFVLYTKNFKIWLKIWFLKSWNLTAQTGFIVNFHIDFPISVWFPILKIHILENGSINIYSRNSENNTSKYPDVIKMIQDLIKQLADENPKYKINTAVVDAEVVAYDCKNNIILPFQVLSTRKRKVRHMSKFFKTCLFNPFRYYRILFHYLFRKYLQVNFYVLIFWGRKCKRDKNRSLHICIRFNLFERKVIDKWNTEKTTWTLIQLFPAHWQQVHARPAHGIKWCWTCPRVFRQVY